MEEESVQLARRRSPELVRRSSTRGQFSQQDPDVESQDEPELPPAAVYDEPDPDEDTAAGVWLEGPKNVALPPLRAAKTS